MEKRPTDTAKQFWAKPLKVQRCVHRNPADAAKRQND
jgi:hypothetical protein